MNPPIKPDVLLGAYAMGFFPMAEHRTGPVHWYSPDPRAIIPLESFEISRSLRQTLRKNIFDVRVDSDFESVIRSCANREDTWISEDIIRSYLELYQRGYAHSVEAWFRHTLVGGLYGVALGGAFFGESMYSRMRDASKVTLVNLVNRLRERRFELLDTQFITPHLRQFGTIEISRVKYLTLLHHAIQLPRRFT